jgi:hypothetical protein
MQSRSTDGISKHLPNEFYTLSSDFSWGIASVGIHRPEANIIRSIQEANENNEIFSPNKAEKKTEQKPKSHNNKHENAWKNKHNPKVIYATKFVVSYYFIFTSILGKPRFVEVQLKQVRWRCKNSLLNLLGYNLAGERSSEY